MSKNVVSFLVLFTLASVVLFLVFIKIEQNMRRQIPLKQNIFITLQKQPLNLRGTVYPPKTTQTKKYVILASGIKVLNNENILQNRYCSISQDLLLYFSYGDTIRVQSDHKLLNGTWIIHDCMAPHMTESIDFFISRSDLPQFRQGVYNIKVDETW